MPFVLANIFQPLIDLFESILKWFHDSIWLPLDHSSLPVCPSSA